MAKTALRCLLLLIISCSTQLLAFNNIASHPLPCQRLSSLSSSLPLLSGARKGPSLPTRSSRRSTLVLRMAEEDAVAEEVETVDVEARAVSIEELKRDLLITMAGSNRGLSATKAQRDAIIDLVSQLEASNPTAAPNSNLDSLCGTWRLMFTTAYDVLSLGAIPLVQTGEIFQNIRASDPDNPGAGLAVDNVVNLQPAADAILSALGGGSSLELVVRAKGTIVGEDRVDIVFLNSKFQPQRKGGGEGGREAGFIRTSFLDADMRIARGGTPGMDAPASFSNNNIFILWRDP